MSNVLINKKKFGLLSVIALIVGCGEGGCNKKDKPPQPPPLPELRLVSISDAIDADAVADIIFVHGLSGDFKSTWHPTGDEGAFWPKLLDDQISEVNVWSLDYPASKFKWQNGAMPLFDRATSILGEYEEHGIGQRPIVFVCHSLGGLVTKKVLEVAESGDLNWQRIPNQTRGIVFLATPHSGSNVANWVKYIQGWLDVDVTTDAVKDLEPHSALLRELNLSYQQMVEKYSIRTQVYYEKRKTRVLGNVSVLVVDESSANPNVSDHASGRVIPVAVDKNHYGICQPNSDRDPPFGRISKFIEECLPRGSHDTKVWTSINVGLGTVPSRLKIIELPLTRKDELLPPALRREIELARDENTYNPPDVDRFAYESLALSPDVNPPSLKIPASINARIYVCLLDELSETSKLMSKPSSFHEEGPVPIESSNFDGNIRIVAFVFPLDEAAYRYYEQNGFDSTIKN